MKLVLALLMGSLFFLSACGSVQESFRLKSGERLSADQHLVVSEATFESGSVVEGDLNLTASKVIIAGRIQGDVTLVASELELHDTTRIEGDLFYCLVREERLERDNKAVIWGRVINRCDVSVKDRLAFINVYGPTLGFRIAANIGLALIAGLISAIGTIFFPRQMRRISRASIQYRGQAFGLGCLTFLVAAGLSTLWLLTLALVIPIIFVPLISLSWVILGVLTVFGSLAVTQPAGNWLAKLLRFDTTVPVVSAMLGTSLVTFIVFSFSLIPVLRIGTSILLVVWVSWALGATLLTRVGSRVYDDFYAPKN